MSVSHWRRRPDPEQISTGVAIVGGGVCAVSAALALQERGTDCVVLERHRLGEGASTRNAGFLMRGAADNYLLGIHHLGREMARTAWRWSEENLDLLRALGIGSLPSYRDVPSCLIALDAEEEAELCASADLLREDGFDVALLEPGEAEATDAMWASGRARLGLINPNDGAVSPADLMGLLIARLRCRVLEGEEVASIEPAPGGTPGVVLRTPSCLVRAERALVCTNAFAPALLPALDGVITPRRGQMLSVAPADHAGLRLERSYYLNRGNEYVRQAADGTIVFGGCRARFAEREVGVDDRTTPWVQGAIEDLWAELLGGGEKPRVSARWAGTMGFSPDGLPLIGPVPGNWTDRSVWFCGGFTGHGMSLGHRSARACVGEMLDDIRTPFPLARALASV